ncbi:MAG: type II secretion system protein F [Clostridiales bacterium]|nr:type II secretion system protein F [Clostridiales bacterium]
MKGPIIYNKYEFSKKEWVESILIGVALILGISYLFYESFLPALILSPSMIVIVSFYKEKLKRERKEQLNIQFKDGITALSASLATGYAIENAFREAYMEVSLLYGKNSLISKEFEYMINQIQINITVEDILEDFARRSGLEDIENFAQIFKIAKRSGGELIQVICSTAETIAQKIDTKREIHTILSSKKYEQRIMNIIPFGIILYIKVSNPGFLDIMYETIMGRIIMSICLIIYCISYKMSESIVNINV